MSKLINVNGQNEFDQEVIQETKTVLVDFWAPWCGPCLMMAPVLEELSEEMKDKLKIVKVDTDSQENQDLAWKYQIQSIPNLKLFKAGKVVKEFIGYRPKEILLQELADSI